MALTGSELFVFVYDKSVEGSDKYAFVGEEKTHSVEQSNNLIEAHSKKDTHAKYVYGKQDGKLSVEANYNPNAQAGNPEESGLLVLKKSKKAKKPVELMLARVTPDGSGGYTLSDKEYTIGYVESISHDYPDEDHSTVTVEIQLIDVLTDTPRTIDESQLVGSAG